jgi:hypothetical protein
VKQLTGYVLVKETNVGIGTVVVAAFDAKDASPSSDHSKSPHLQHLGRPLGSVVTDSHGRFELNVEARATEARPKLVVAVFAPEDARSVDEPRPEPAEKRLMFVSREAREEAAPQEAFIIRLPQAQLDHHALGQTRKPDATAARQARVADAIEAAWGAPAYLRDRFKERLSANVAAKAKRRAAAAHAVRNLSGIPRHLRDGETRNPLQNNSLLIADRRDLADRLPELQYRAIEEGLKRLHKRRLKPITRLYLSRGEIKSLGLTWDEKTGRVSGEVPAEKFRTKVREAIEGYAITKSGRTVETSVAKLRDRYKALEEASPAKQTSEALPSAASPKAPRPSGGGKPKPRTR